MKDAAEYLTYIKALIVSNPLVVRWALVREEAQGSMGLFRYRLTMRDGGMLEMFERFQVADGKVQVTKYSFHWQDSTGQLLKRWDNAAHHPEIKTSPHHLHDGADETVLPHKSMSAGEVLTLLSEEAAD